MRPRRRAGAPAAAAALATGAVLVTSGCAGTDAPPVEVVTITSHGFDPASVDVPAGTELRFVNQVPGRASVTSLELTDPTNLDGATSGVGFDSGPLAQGEAFSLLLEESGEHVYHSTFHTELNWVGTITVEGP